MGVITVWSEVVVAMTFVRVDIERRKLRGRRRCKSICLCFVLATERRDHLVFAETSWVFWVYSLGYLARGLRAAELVEENVVKWPALGSSGRLVSRGLADQIVLYDAHVK